LLVRERSSSGFSLPFVLTCFIAINECFQAVKHDYEQFLGHFFGSIFWPKNNWQKFFGQFFGGALFSHSSWKNS
jgi:hypothetical protein